MEGTRAMELGYCKGILRDGPAFESIIKEARQPEVAQKLEQINYY